MTVFARVTSDAYAYGRDVIHGKARGAILARATRALVHGNFAAFASEARDATTEEGIDLVHAATTVQAGTTFAFVNVTLAQCPLVPRDTCALKAVHQVQAGG